MGKKNNSPTNWSSGLSVADKSDMLSVFEEFRQMPAVEKTDIEEINERLNTYFKRCTEYGIVPTVESLSLILGVSRQAMWKWKKENCEAGELVERAKAIINAMLTTATLQGKTNFAYAIWLQKNHFGYTDAQRVEIANLNERKPLSNAELPKLDIVKEVAKELPKLNISMNNEEN